MCQLSSYIIWRCLKLYFAVPKGQTNIWAVGVQAEDLGIINQKGLNRKVQFLSFKFAGFR